MEKVETKPKFFERAFGGDRALWIVITMLTVVSILVVYSSTASMAYRKAGGNTTFYVVNQLKFIFLSFLTVYIVHRLNYQTYAKYARLLFIASLIFMVLTFFIGVNLNQASRWLPIPGTGYTFQPSDFLKVTLVMVLARQLARKQSIIDRTPLIPIIPIFGKRLTERQRAQNKDILFETTLPILLPIAMACGAIFFSNLSTAAITFFSCLIMLYIGRVRMRELWRVVRLVVVTMAVVLVVMSTLNIGRSRTWINRVTDFVGIEQSDQVGSDYLQVEQAKIAIASGELFGKGPGLSTQRANLPHSYSDFAYAFIVEEYGLLGAMVVLVLYLWLFFRTIVIFRRCQRAFPALLVLGLGAMITLQAILNMLVSVNLFPVTGQTLPIISLGGSSLLFTSLALGMILGVSRQMQQKTLGDDKEERITGNKKTVKR